MVGQYRLLYVMAAEAEYGPNLRQLLEPLITGVGPVEAAVSVASTLGSCKKDANSPDLIVSLGSAGSNTLKQAEIYQANSVSYRDMDASPLGFEKGLTPFLNLPAIIPLHHRVKGVASASLSTGANIVSGEMYGAIDADMVDMESYAVMRACQAFRLPLICLRGISDGASDLQHIGDWTRYLHVIDEKLAQIVSQLESQLADGRLRL